MAKIHPIIMSGGSGTRLWPVSRALYPKQFLKLASTRTMLQDAVMRVSDKNLFEAPVIICAEEHRFIIAEQLRELEITPAAIMLEPMPRSTSAVAALACHYLRERVAGESLFLLMPTDHVVGDVKAFMRVCEAAAKAALEGYLTTFGILPEAPEIGYGYIKPGEAVSGGAAQRIAAFVEKPDKKTAEDYVREGYLWNSGMFLFPASLLLQELTQYQPEVVKHTAAAFQKATRDLDFIRLDPVEFAKVPAVSIDYGLMERTQKSAVVPASIKWNDIGSWTSLWECAAKDAQGNVTRGDVLLQGATNSFVQSDGPLTVALGVDDLVIVALDDVVMVAEKSRAQEVRDVVEQLKKQGRKEVQHARRVHRPWGWFESLGEGARFQIKRLRVEAGRALSYQMHHHRSEHWVVVEGMAKVIKNDQEILVYENESLYLPAGTKHRLENPGKVPLVVVEVQSGAYLGEDDIVRFEDQYGRK
jgi:mannose-1-phosphate guanylyltransferase/mannose-6-phosphate isomerase